MLYTLATHARTHNIYAYCFFHCNSGCTNAPMWRHSYLTCRVDTGFCWGKLKERDRPENKTTITGRKQQGNRTCDAWLMTGTNDRFHERSETFQWVTLFKDSVHCTFSYRGDILGQFRYPRTNAEVLVCRRRQGFNDWTSATGKQKPQNFWHNQIQRPGLTGSK